MYFVFDVRLEGAATVGDAAAESLRATGETIAEESVEKTGAVVTEVAQPVGAVFQDGTGSAVQMLTDIGGSLPDDFCLPELDPDSLPDGFSLPELNPDSLPDDFNLPERETDSPPGDVELLEAESDDLLKNPGGDMGLQKDNIGEGREKDGSERKMETPAKVVFKYLDGCEQEEFNRQLKAQEKGLNDMTVEEFLKNREKFKENNGRDVKESGPAQEQARGEAEADKVREYRDQGMSKEEAEAKAKEWMKDKAVLHNPDQVAGGDPNKVTGVGDSRINSSIGSQWGKGGLAESLERQVRDYIEKNDISAEDLDKIKMNVQLDVV